MMSILRPFVLAIGSAGLITVACGSAGCGSSAGDSTFQDPNGNLFGDGGQNGSSGSSGDFGSSGSSGNPGGVTPGSACATSNAGANALPVYLVFMIDKSGSMDQNSKWPSATAALDNFFGSATSTGLYASVAFFKQNDECNPAAYATPAVPMTALPAGPTFQNVIAKNKPNGGTPTIAAEQGAIQYAQSVQAGLKNGEKVVIVLVTDGDPNDCAQDPKNVVAAAAEVAAAAKAVSSTIPTYVIGVGPDAQNLNAIAAGGGTGQAIMVATNNPAQTTADLEKAIGQVKSQTLGCDYILPAPPNGQTIDINAVNVNYTSPTGQTQTLSYSASCTDPNGWHYDNPATPTKVQMCPGICAQLKAAPQGVKIDIVFGCKTQGGVTK